jgi:hypothetical protein
VDGDGAADTLYVGVKAADGARVFGVVTATGVASQWAVANASPVPPSILGVADADDDGHAEIFVNPGRIVDVLTFRDCQLVPYTNREGEPYGFDVGLRGTGTGAGCVDADGDGRRDLVGLLAEPLDANRVRWHRTIVELDGTEARNGASDTGEYQRPADDDAIALLSTFTCGDQTFDDPLTAGPG